MKNRVQALAVALAAVGVAASGKYYGTPEQKDTTLYLAFNANGKGGETQLVDANTKKIYGTTNLDGDKLDPGRYLALDGVRALFESADGATFATAKWDSAVLAALYNSELVITQGKEIFSIPCSEIFNLHRSNAITNDGDFREISHIPVIKPDSTFKITWKFPEGVNVAAAAGASALVRLEFRGHEIVYTA